MHGEGRFDVLGNRYLVSGDGDLDDVTFVARRAWLVGNLGTDRGLVQIQVFEFPRIRAADGVDSVNYRLVSANIDVIRRSCSGRASGAVGRDDNSGAIGQLEVQLCVVVDRQAVFVGQRDGVSDLATPSVTEGVAVNLATTSSVVSVT